MSVQTTTSRFFQNHQYTGEQRLYEALLDQCMQQYGIDVIYVKRNYVNINNVYGEDDQSSYTDTVMIAMYVKNVMGFSGDKDFMSKFAGLEIRDQVIFTVTQRMFKDGVGLLPVPKGKIGTTTNRPREGDLIFFPLNKRCFQIKYVDQYSMFFQMGKLYAWDITCELFEYSNERFDTGIPDIDRMMTVSINVLDYALKDGANNFILTENNDYLTTDAYTPDTIDTGQDNHDVNVEANGYVDWSEDNPFTDFTTPNQE
jgi:hypothetical protein